MINVIIGVKSTEVLFMTECFKQRRIGEKIGSNNANSRLLNFAELGNQDEIIYKNKMLSNITKNI